MICPIIQINVINTSDDKFMGCGSSKGKEKLNSSGKTEKM